MQLISLYESHFKQSLTATQLQTLKILIWLLTVQKTVKIERLAACFPLRRAQKSGGDRDRDEFFTGDLEEIREAVRD
jgi:hypothetical protein